MTTKITKGAAVAVAALMIAGAVSAAPAEAKKGRNDNNFRRGGIQKMLNRANLSDADRSFLQDLRSRRQAGNFQFADGERQRLAQIFRDNNNFRRGNWGDRDNDWGGGNWNGGNNWNAGWGGGNNCGGNGGWNTANGFVPPGLAKKPFGMPPGQAKKLYTQAQGLTPFTNAGFDPYYNQNNFNNVPFGYGGNPYYGNGNGGGGIMNALGGLLGGGVPQF